MKTRPLLEGAGSWLGARRRSLPGAPAFEPVPILLLAVLFLVGLYFVVGRFTRIFTSSKFNLSPLETAAVIAVACSAGLLYARVVAWLDKNEREPWLLVVSVLILGAVAGPGVTSGVTRIVQRDIMNLLAQPPINSSEYAVLFPDEYKVLALDCEQPKAAGSELYDTGRFDYITLRRDLYDAKPAEDRRLYVASEELPDEPHQIIADLGLQEIGCSLPREHRYESPQDFFRERVWLDIRERIWQGRDPARFHKQDPDADPSGKQPLLVLRGREWRGIGPKRVGPLLEEAVKGLILLLVVIALGREFNGPVDGIVYGALIGLGFAVTENAVYMLQHGFEEQFFNRIVLRGLTGHATYTAFTGLGLGIAYAALERWRRGSRGASGDRQGWMIWLAPILGFGLAVGAHLVWNNFNDRFMSYLSPDWLNPIFRVIVLQVPFVIVLGLGLWFSWRRENSMIRAHLPADLFAPEAFAGQGDLRRARDRHRARLRAWRALGYQGWRWVGRLHRALIETAFYQHYATAAAIDDATSSELLRLRGRVRELVDQVAELEKGQGDNGASPK